ncbi:hypothetical protein ACPCIR_12760 [Mycobacterium sp. NPDC051198]
MEETQNVDTVQKLPQDDSVRNEAEVVSISRNALDVLIADLERSRRVGWARAYAAEAELARGDRTTGQASDLQPVAHQADVSDEVLRQAAVSQIGESLRVITRWFKPLWYGAAWDAGHRQLRQIRDEDLEWARGLWGDRRPGEHGYIDDTGVQTSSNAPRPRDWIEIVVGLLRAGVSEEIIEQSVRAAMTTSADPADLWSTFMDEVENRW